MKNLPAEIIRKLFATSTAHRLPVADTDNAPFQNHNSDSISTQVMKDHGGILLIKSPWVATGRIQSGNTILPAVTRVFPLSFNSTKKDVYASNRYP